MAGGLARFEIAKEAFLLAQLRAGMNQPKKTCQASGIGIPVPRGEFGDTLQPDGRQKQKRKPRSCADVTGFLSEKETADARNRQDNERGDPPRRRHFAHHRGKEDNERRNDGQKEKDVVKLDQGGPITAS
jgi:hypothetical protein